MTSPKKQKQAILLIPFFTGIIFLVIGWIIGGIAGAVIGSILGLFFGLFLKSEKPVDSVETKSEEKKKKTGQNVQMNLSFECEEDESKYIGHYLFIDTETTGLPKDYSGEITDSDNWPYVVQIAWLMFNKERKLIVREDHILKQNVVIPESAIRIHGITNEKMNELGVSPHTVLNLLVIV